MSVCCQLLRMCTTDPVETVIALRLRVSKEALSSPRLHWISENVGFAQEINAPLSLNMLFVLKLCQL